MFDLWLSDYGFIREIYCNLHQITPDVWRSAQPAPHHLRKLAKRGVRTVVNLRGRRNDGAHILERDTCHRLGLTLVDFPIRSRGALDKATIHAAAELFPTLQYPVLFHCKSGADRAGMVATLYLHLYLHRPLRDAMRQLSLYYGHVKHARTGVIDYFFERYLAATKDRPMPLLQWVDECYDPAELDTTFRENRLARFLVDTVLRRE